MELAGMLRVIWLQGASHEARLKGFKNVPESGLRRSNSASEPSEKLSSICFEVEIRRPEC
jgi:hypothetical protein